MLWVARCGKIAQPFRCTSSGWVRAVEGVVAPSRPVIWLLNILSSNNYSIILQGSLTRLRPSSIAFLLHFFNIFLEASAVNLPYWTKFLSRNNSLLQKLSQILWVITAKLRCFLGGQPFFRHKLILLSKLVKST